LCGTVAEVTGNWRRVLGVSQPTVGRMIKELEKEGIIKEYTMIPDFCKLGYGLLVLTFVRHAKQFDSKELDNITRMGIERARRERSQESIMAERGIGLGYGSVIISYEKDYSSYTALVERLKQFEHLDLSTFKAS
jgi:DNA-binding Lrp family transcriptional regulator